MHFLMRFAILCAAAGFGILSLAQPTTAQPTTSQSTTWHVDRATCPGPGTGSEADPFCTIGEAIAASSDGDTVLVQPGRYAETVDFTGKEIVVRSAAGPEVTILDGEDTRRVVRMYDFVGAGGRLEGFTVTGGRGNSSGGGILIRGFATISGCVIVGNEASDGAGIAVRGGFPRIEKCRIQDNRTSSFGCGGIYVSSVADIADCQILDNEGNGIEFDGTLLETWSYVRNCLIARNDRHGIHGWTFGDYHWFDISDCTIVDNGSTGMNFECFDWPVVLVSHCILWGNPFREDECGGISTSFSLVEGGVAGAILDEDPLFHPGSFYLIQDGTTTSPCVDAGDTDTQTPGTTSIDGQPDTGPRDLGYHYPEGLATVANCQGRDQLDVLRVNGSPGSAPDHEVQVSRSAGFDATMSLPAGGGNGAFVVQLHAGSPDASTLTPLPANLGSSCFDFRIAPAGAGTPFAVWNNLGRRGVVGRSLYFGEEADDPDPAPSTFWSLPAGDWPYLALGTRWTLQAVISNPDATGGRPLSVTNSIVIEVTD